MKVTLDLKDFEIVLRLGVQALFKDAAVNITDIITPFATFNLSPFHPKRENLSNQILDTIKNQGFIHGIKLFRLTIGCGLKESKEFCEKLRGDPLWRDAWVRGDNSIIKTWTPADIDAYDYWLNKTGE